MTRLLYDSTNINDIPKSASMVGFYTDGIYAASLVGVRARFPSATLVGISAVGTNSGIVGDVEPGCMTFNQGIAWVKMRRAAGLDPTIYCNQNNAWSGLRDAFRRAGVAAPHWWVANYDGVRVVPPGAVAKQYANPPMTGGHYDLSVVADVWPGVDDGLHGGGGGTATGDDMTPVESDLLYRIFFMLADPATTDPATAKSKEPWTGQIWDRLKTLDKLATTAQLAQAVTDLKAVIAAVPAGSGGGLSNAQVQQIAGIASSVEAIRLRVEKDLAP